MLSQLVASCVLVVFSALMFNKFGILHFSLDDTQQFKLITVWLLEGAFGLQGLVAHLYYAWKGRNPVRELIFASLLVASIHLPLMLGLWLYARYPEFAITRLVLELPLILWLLHEYLTPWHGYIISFGRQFEAVIIALLFVLRGNSEEVDFTEVEELRNITVVTCGMTIFLIAHGVGLPWYQYVIAAVISVPLSYVEIFKPNIKEDD